MADVESAASVDNAGDVAGAARVHSSTTNEEDGPDVSPRQTGNAAAAAHSDTDGATDIEQLRASLRALEAREFKAFVKIKQLESERDQLLAEKRDGDKSGEAISASVNVSTLRTLKTMRQKLELAERQRDELEVRCRELEGQVGRLRGPETHAEGDPQRALRVEERLQQLLADFGEGYQHKLAQAPSEVGKGDSPPHIAFAIKKVAALQTELAETQERLQEALAGKGALLSSFTNREPPQSPTSPMSPIERVHSDVSGDVDSPMLATHASSESLLLQRKLSKAEADRDAAQRTASVLRKTVMDLKRKREKGPAGDAGGQSVFEDLHKENLRLRREVQEVQQQRRVAEQAIEGLKTHLPDLPSSEDGDAQERLSDNDILAAIPEADRYAVRTLGCYMGVERAAAALRCADGNIGLATSRLSDDRRIVTEKKKTRLMRNHDADRAAFETHENDRRAAEEQLEGSARRDMCRWEEEARLRVHKAEETLYFIRARKAHDALLACGREEFGARGGVELVQQGAWEYIFRAEEQARLLPRGSPSKGADLVALRARVAELEALLAAERVRQPAGPGTPPRDRSPEASSPDELSPAGGHASDDAGGVPGLSEQEKIDVLDAELRTVTERLRDEKHRTAGLEARVAEVCSMEARLRAAEVERDVYRKSTQDLQTTLEEMKVEQMALSQQAEADRRTRDEELAGVREELRAAQQLLEEKALALTSAGQKLRDADASTGAARDRLTASETRCAALETALVAAEVGNGSNGDGGNDALAASAQRSKRLELDMARLHEELTNVAAAAARDKAAREGDVSALRVALAEKADELKRAEDDGAAAREAAATSVAQVKEVSQRCAELERENVSLRARVTSELEGIAIKREKSSGETEVEVDDKSEAPSRGSAPPHHKRVPSKYSAWDISRATTLEPGAGRAQLTQDANDFALVSPTTATESMMPAWDGVPLAGGDAVAKQNEALHTQTERLRREQERLEGEAKEHEQRCEDLLQLISAMDAAAAEEARSDVHSLPDSTATLKALVVALREEVSDTQQQRDRAESKLRDAEAMKTAPGNVDGDAATDDPVQHNGDEQEARLAAAVKQCTDLHADLAEARAEGEARRGELEGKLADAMRREGELRATAVEADRRLSRMQDELDEAVRRGRAAAARVDALEEELYATRQQADATVEAVKAHTTAAEMQIAELTDDRDKQLAGMQAAVDEARRLQREVGARCEDLERQLGAAEGRAEELLSIMADSSDAVERAANDQTLQLEGLRAALESARAQQRTDKARCESLEGELVAAEARVEEMRSQVAHGRAAVDEAARRGVMVEALQGELEAAREAQRREAARRGELEQRLAAAETRGAELRELSVEGDTELEVMRGALRSYKESRDGERTRCEDLEKKLEAAEAHVTELRAEISSTAADHNVQLDALRNKLDACRVQQDAASARCAELEEKLVAAEARAEELEAQLVGARRDGEEDLSEGAREELRVLETALSEAKERQHKEEARRMELERGLAAAEARVAELLERDHSEQADALRGELEECSKQHSADRERCGELEGKLAAAEARVGELLQQSRGAAGCGQLGQLEAEVAEVRDQQVGEAVRCADLEGKLAAAEVRAQDIEARVAAAAEERGSEEAQEEQPEVVASASDKSHEHQHQETSYHKDLEEKLKAAEMRAYDLSAELSVAAGHSMQLDALRNKLDACRVQQDAASARCAELEEKLAAAEARAEELEAQLVGARRDGEEDLSEAAREELRVLETALSEAKERQHKEEARRMELERGLAAAEARVAELLERDHSEQADALRGELEECSKQHSADRERCGELEGKLAAAEARVGESGGASGYSADGEDLREELNRAELRIADLEAKLSTMRDGTDAGTDTHATEESSALPAATVLRDLEDAKAQRVEMERRYEDVRAQLEAASVQLELLQNVEAGAALKPIAGTEALEEGLGANTDSPVDASDILCAAAVADALDVPRHSPPPCGGAGGTVADDSGLEAAVAAEQVVAKRLHEQLVQLRGAVGEAGGSAEAALAAALADSERLRDTQGAVAGAAAALRAAQQRLAEDLEEKDALLAHIEGEYRDVQGMLEDAEQASLTFRAAMVRRLTESELRRRDLERMVTPDADMPREPQAARAEPTARPDTRAVDSRDDISTGSCGGCKHEQVSDASADGLLRLLNDQCDDLQRCVAGMRASREGWGAQDTSDDGARSVSEPCGGDASVGTAERRGNIEKALELEDADECGVELIEALQRCAALQVAVNDLRTAQASDRSEIAWLRDRLQRERGLAPPPPSAPCAARNADPSATHGTSPQFVAAVEQCSRLHGAVAATGRELEEWRESPARQRPADYRSTDPAGVDALTARCALLEGELAAAHAAMRADEGELRRQLLEALEAQWALENEMVMVKHTVAGGRRVRQQSQAASEAMIEQLEAAEARVEDAEREMREQQMMNSLRRLMENHGATLVVDPNHERGAPLESVPLPDAPHEACAVASVANAPADHGAATQEALEGSCADNAPSTAHDPPPVDVEDLQRRLADAELENELLGARVGQKDKLITCLRELGNVAQQDEATRTALQARIDKLERQNSALREELEDVEDRLNSAMTRNDSLEDALCADDDGQHELINTLKRCEELDVQLAHTRRDLDMARGEVETLREQCGTAQTQGKDLIDALRQCEELEDELRECRVRMGESEGQLGAALNRNDALENALCDNSPNETAEQLIDALKRCEELETALHEAESIAKTEPPASARSVSTDTTERDNRQLRQLLDERQHDLNVALQRQMEFENVVEALQADLQEMTAQCAAQSKALNSLGTGERKERLVEALRQVEELADCEGQPDTDVAQPQGASSAEGKIAEDPDLPGDMNTPPAGSIDAAEGGELRGAGTAAELPGSTASDDASSSACEEAEAAAQQVSHRTELVQRLAASERRRLELEDALEELMDVLARRPSGASAVLADPPQGTDAAAAAVPPDPAPVPPTDSDIIDAIVAVVQREQQQQTAAFKQEVSALHATIGTLQEQVCELSPRSNSVPHRHDEPGNIRDSLMISSEGVATAPASTMDDLSWQLEDAEAALQAAADMRQRLVEELQRRRPTGASEASPLPSPPGAPARSPALTDEAHDALVERLDAACARVAAAETQCTELRDANHVLQEEIAAVRDVEAQLKASQARCADLEAQQQSLAARLEAQDPCGSDAYGALHDRMADLRSQLQAAEQAATAAKAKASAADVQSRALLVHATQLEGRIDSAEGQAAALKDSLEQSQQALHTTEAQLKESKTLCTAVEASNTSLREEVAGTREHAAQLAAQCDAKTRWAEELTAMVDAHKQRCDDLVTAVEAQEQRATAAAAEVADLRGSLAVRDAELQKAEDQCGELQRTVDSLLHEPPVTPVSGVDDAGTFMGQGVEFRTELVQRLAASEKRRTDVESALEDITQLLAVRVADAAPTPTPPQAPSEEPHDVLSAALGLLQAHQQRGHVCASEAGTSDGVFAGETARRLAAVSASQPPVDSEVPPPALPPARLERPGNRGDDETTRLLKRSEERCKALEDTVRAQALTLQRSTEWLPDAASPQRSRETRALLDEAQTCCSDLASAVQELRQASSPQRGPRDELDATRRHCERLQCAVEAMERELRGRAPPRELIDGLSHPQTKYLLDAANRRCRKLQSVVAAQAANLARLEVAKAELEAAVVEVEHQRAALVQQRGGDAEAESTRLAKRCAELEATVESLAHDLAAREDVGGGSPATSKMLRERAAEAEEQRDVLAHRVKSLEAVCANLRRNFAAKLDELVGQGEAVSPRRVVQDRAAARRVGGAGDAPVRPPIARVGGAAEVLLSPPPCEHDDAADADEVERDAHAAAGHLNSAITALRGRLASKVKELETLERSPAGSPRAAALPMSRLLGNTGGGGTAAGHPPR